MTAALPDVPSGVREVTVRDLGVTSTANGEPFHYHFEFFHGGFWEGSTPHHEATI